MTRRDLWFFLRAVWWGFSRPFASGEARRQNAKKLAAEYFAGKQEPK